MIWFTFVRILFNYASYSVRVRVLGQLQCWKDYWQLLYQSKYFSTTLFYYMFQSLIYVKNLWNIMKIYVRKKYDLQSQKRRVYIDVKNFMKLFLLLWRFPMQLDSKNILKAFCRHSLNRLLSHCKKNNLNILFIFLCV